MRKFQAGLPVLLAGVGATLLMPMAAPAQSYPARPVRLIVPFAAGGPVDAVGRLIAPRLSELWGQQVVIDNRAGANSIVGSEQAARAAPDGYTLLLVSAGFAINVSLYPKLPYDALRDFTLIVPLAFGPGILVTHPSLPARNLKELVAMAKAKPGVLTYGSSGPGAPTSHLGMELLKVTAGINLIHVPYKSMAPAMTDILGGQVHMGMPTINVTVQHIRIGRLRAIGVSSLQRSPAMPEVPTFIESGLIGVDSGTYWGCLAPAATPKDIVNKVSFAIATVLKLPDIQQRLIDLGFDPIGGTPEQFAANIKSETEKWARVIKNAGVKLD